MNFQDIADYICENEGITFEQINIMLRKRELVQVRQLIMYMTKKHTNISLEMIGANFVSGGHHANVLASIKNINNLYDTDKHWRSKINMYDAYFSGLYIPFIPTLPSIVDMKLIREHIGITATNVCRDLGMSRSHLRTLERGELKFISYTRIKRLLDYYREQAIEKEISIITLTK